MAGLWLRTPAQVEVTNGAVPGTVSMFMSVCLQSHVPLDADLVVVDYGANDPPGARE
jgi:hypothetical protein